MPHQQAFSGMFTKILHILQEADAENGYLALESDPQEHIASTAYNHVCKVGNDHTSNLIRTHHLSYLFGSVHMHSLAAFDVCLQ